jgi:hypothetical protein
MTVLDSFYLLFRTDAKQAQAEVAALEKQIEALKAKGNQRSQDEEKALKESIKQHKELAKNLKETTEQTDKLGQSFVKTIENAAGAATSLFAFSAIKAGVKNVTDFNSQLLVTARILNQSPRSLSAFANAAELAGGTKEGAIAQYQSLFNFYAARGLKNPTPENLLTALRGNLASRKTAEAKSQLLQQIGISDTGIIALGEESRDAFGRNIAQGQSTALSEAQIEKLRDLQREEAQATQELTHFFGVLTDEISGLLIPAIKEFSEFLHAVTRITGGSTALAAAGVIGGGAIARPLARGLLSYLGIGGAAAGAGEAAAGLGLGGVTAGAAAIGLGAWWLFGKEQDLINRTFGRKSSSPNNQSALRFWQSQGFTRDQAAGIAGNEYAESSGNPLARNYAKGIHFGLYQWSEERRARIKAAIGIDVATASAEDQRKAAAWELHQRGDDARIHFGGLGGGLQSLFRGFGRESGTQGAPGVPDSQR